VAYKKDKIVIVETSTTTNHQISATTTFRTESPQINMKTFSATQLLIILANPVHGFVSAWRSNTINHKLSELRGGYDQTIGGELEIVSCPEVSRDRRRP
jgi:hypothetical protein